MFAKLCTLALALPLVSALTFESISGWTTGATVTVTWTASTTDPTSFSIELANPSYHNSYAIATNVVTANGQVTIELPAVEPGDGYSLQAVAIGDINQIYYETPSTFSIGAATSSSTTGASTTSTTASSSMSMPALTVTTSSAAATTLVSSASTATTTGTSSAASSTPSTFKSSGAASFKLAGIVPAAALVLSAVTGAAMVF
ncbi:hypothetical protein OG21DRAFT_1513219 [Imleria badia]|nr:hypothetical protein OG21DRAFT_1513219 [Imleria badia]